jgi:plastocyanin
LILQEIKTAHTSYRVRTQEVGSANDTEEQVLKVNLGRKRTMTKMNMWITGLAMPVMAMLLLLAGSPNVRAADQPSAATAEVKIDNFSFGPQTITVHVGATVTWTNRDDIPHTVVSTDGMFKSKVRDTDEKFSYTFTKAGTYSYFCSVHPKMTGKVVVQ